MSDDVIPVRIGRHWLFADGTLLPVISGGSDDGGADGGNGGADEGQGGAKGTGQGAPDPAAEVAKWKAMARKHEAQAKANAEAAARLKELENAGKSETEKLQAALAEAQANARASTIKALKLQVAAEKGLPANLAKFLPDLDNEIDMMQAADELLEAAGGAGKAPTPTRQPKSNLTDPMHDDDQSAAAQREALIQSMLGKATA